MISFGRHYILLKYSSAQPGVKYYFANVVLLKRLYIHIYVCVYIYTMCIIRFNKCHTYLFTYLAFIEPTVKRTGLSVEGVRNTQEDNVLFLVEGIFQCLLHQMVYM